LIKDHRTGLESSRVNDILDGEIDTFIRGFLLARWEGTLSSGTGQDDLPDD
jgi:peptide chain release factor 2